MTLFRYLTRQLLGTTVGVTLILMVIIMTSRFIQYLGEAASGELAADILLWVILFRVPGFLEVILPLGLYLSVLLVYGRLHADSEMPVLFACGISPARLFWMTLGPVVLVAVVVAGLTLWVSPLGAARTQEMLNDPRNGWGLATLVPGQFQQRKLSSRVNYAEKLTDNRTRMENVFIASRSHGDDGAVTSEITVALSGRVTQDEASGVQYLELRDGYRFQGRPGRRDFTVTRFDTYGQRLRDDHEDDRVKLRSEARPTSRLWVSDKPWDRAVLHWRLALPWLVPISVLMAWPLSRTNPRQGRYLTMIPAVLLFLFYLVLLITVRDGVATLKFASPRALWNVHWGFLGIAVLLWQLPRVLRQWDRWQQKRHAEADS